MRVATAQSLEDAPNTVWIVVGVRDSGKGLSPDGELGHSWSLRRDVLF
jgi:hypothetical protein